MHILLGFLIQGIGAALVGVVGLVTYRDNYCDNDIPVLKALLLTGWALTWVGFVVILVGGMVPQ